MGRIVGVCGGRDCGSVQNEPSVGECVLPHRRGMLGKWLGPQEAVALLGFAEGDQILLDQVRWERSSAGSHFPFWLGEALDYPPPPGSPPGPCAVHRLQ